MMEQTSAVNNIHGLASDALNSSGGDVEQATALLESRAKNDSTIWMALTGPLLSQACYDAVRKICREQRREIWFSENYDKGGNGDRVAIHAKGLLDWPLPGGKRLRDAGKEDLDKAADFYHRQASQMMRVAYFLERISEKVGKKTVGDKFTEEKLREIQRKIDEE